MTPNKLHETIIEEVKDFLEEFGGFTPDFIEFTPKHIADGVLDRLAMTGKISPISHWGLHEA